MTVTSDAGLVLFSGGQDSTVCLASALERFARVENIGLDYAASAMRRSRWCGRASSRGRAGCARNGPPPSATTTC